MQKGGVDVWYGLGEERGISRGGGEGVKQVWSVDGGARGGPHVVDGGERVKRSVSGAFWR